MANRTVYTSTVTTSVYACWKCEHCGELNFSPGKTRCVRQVSTAAFRRSKHEDAKRRAKEMAKTQWLEEAFNIVTDPCGHPKDVLYNLSLDSTSCTKCGKKPSWQMNPTILNWCALAFIPAIITGLMAFAAKTNFLLWSLFAFFLIAILYSFYAEWRLKCTMNTLPKAYRPVIGSENIDLYLYASARGKCLPSPEDCVEVVLYGKLESRGDQASEDYLAFAPESEPYIYCRKCGTRFKQNSGYCDKCGTKSI